VTQCVTGQLFVGQKRSVRFRRIYDRVGPIVTGGYWWQRPLFHVVQLDSLFDNLTKLGKHGLLVIAMAAAIKQSGTATDKAMVFIGPFDNFDVSGRHIHDLDSSIALLTARS
jgi:hypothetical protein